METERWQQVDSLLQSALERPPEERETFLRDTCGSDLTLEEEVRSLLSAYEHAGSFLESPAIKAAAQIIDLNEDKEEEQESTRSIVSRSVSHYRILRKLGAGGMGEVYRAHDSVLKRDVAIKILPTYVAQDADRLRRFEQEAQAAAALNHPNILAIHEFGTFEGVAYLISELLEGNTLRELLRRGPVPIRKVIDYGIQIAHGLAAAHEKGIVHRDLKPENLFVSKDGHVKILDFGLAKLLHRESEAHGVARPVMHDTDPEIVAGTPGYMAPEQVRRRPADHRTDIFAFGATLYEMLSGKRAFQRGTSTETMNAILNEEPPGISQVVPSAPTGLQRVVHRCLEKNPEQRFQSASDLAFALEALSDSGTASGLGVASMRKRRVYWWVATAVMMVVSALAVVVYLTRSARPPITPTLTRLTWDSGLSTDPALSPDGKLIAYASDRSGEGHFDIYIQQIGGGAPLRLTSGPGDKTQPAFSPDGTKIAFHSEESGGIDVVPTLGGTRRIVVPEGNRPQFSPDGAWIAYSTGVLNVVGLNVPDTHIYVVASAGGTPRQVRPDFAAAIDPVWSPDGLHLLFLGNSDASKPAEEAIDWWVTPLTGGPAIKTGALEITRKAKLGGDSQGYPWALIAPAWEPDGGGLVFHGQSGDSVNLWRIAISPTTFKASGPLQRLTSGLRREENPSVASGVKGTVRVAFSSIDEGLAVWSLPINPNEGKVIGNPQRLTQDAGGDFMPSISRDGNKVVYISTRPDNEEIWIRDLKTGQESELTTTRVKKYFPMFSPDGSMVSFGEVPTADIYVVASNGGVAENVCAGCGEATDWSPDGKRIIGNTANGQAWVLDLASRRKSNLFNTQRWIATNALSYDGRWFDFLVVDKGIHSYIARFDEAPVPETAWIPVMGDGEAAIWSPDGKLVYATSYRDGHWCLWARHFDPSTGHPVGEWFPVFHAHSPRLLLAPEREESIAGNEMVLGMAERTGNIWMAEWKEK